MSDAGPLTTIGSASVTAAGTQALDPVTLRDGLAGLSGWMRLAGAGGISVDAYLQETPDGGTTWFDLVNAHFTAAGVSLFSLVHGAAANLAVTDASLASNTVLNSGVVPLFDKYRLKIVSVGTWNAGTSLVCQAMPRG